jgi:hypothetical protein
LIGKFTPSEIVPPGLSTVITTLVGSAIRVAGTEAVSCVALISVVDKAELNHITTEPATKPLPVTVRVNEGPPAIATSGLTLVIFGMGLEDGLIVKLAGLEIMPPGFSTVIWMVAGDRIS